MSVLTMWVHEHVFDAMSKARPSPSKKSEPAVAAVPGAPLISETKDSINLRIDARSRQRIDKASAILDKTRTEFMTESARRQAINVVLGQRVFSLDAERYDAFAHALDNPPTPGPKLRSLLRRVPAWEK